MLQALSFAEETLDRLPSGFVIIGDNGAVIYANQKFLTMVGRDSRALTGLKFDVLLTRGSAIFFETQFLPSLLLRGNLDEIALDIVKPDGKPLPVFVNATFHHDDHGGPSQIHLSLFGATQRRLYEAELLRARRSFEETAEIVRRSADGIIRFSADGKIDSWNNGAQQIFGYTAEERNGQLLQTLFPPERLGDVEEALRSLMLGQDVYRETVAQHLSGRTIDVSLSLTPHMEVPGIFVGFSAIIRDTTSRKMAEKASLQSEKLASVGRLASSIAHEINNPLESVTNLLYILESRIEDPETRQFVITAQEELARVSEIATHTLRFHKQSSNRTEVDFQKLTESVLALYCARLESAHVTAISQCTPNLRLSCYEGEVRQIMVNLVSNAYDALRLGGNLVIRAHRSRNWHKGTNGLRVLVADSGSGMNADTLARVFEPFFSTKGIGGTGLGLWISKDLIAKNDGTISARSTVRSGRSGTVMNLFFEDPAA